MQSLALTPLDVDALVDRVCEGGTLDLDCGGKGDGLINVQFASYGRQHGPDVCPHAATGDQSCHETTSTAIVAAACQGEAACSIEATNGIFGDPCGGTYKYLTVNYDCGGDSVSTCEGGQPSSCSSECARIFGPFYSKCAEHLEGVAGLDLEAVTGLCQGSGAATVGGFLNGGFDDEEEDICTYTCRDGHEWGPFAGTACGHKYMEPVGWSSSSTVVICNSAEQADPHWGGLISGASANYLSIQNRGAFIEQTVTGLTPGATYEISFLATHRPCGNDACVDGNPTDNGFGAGEALRILVDGEEIFHSNSPGTSGVAFHANANGRDEFQPYTAIFSIDPASPDFVAIRVENDSTEGDKSIFIDSLVIREGHSWSYDATCGAQWSPWQLATPATLRRAVPNTNFQYRYSDLATSAYYLTPVSTLVWDWNAFQGLSGEYMFVTADGTQDAFDCTVAENGFIGIGCSNGPGGDNWKVFADSGGVTIPERAEVQVCDDHPDAFENGGCGPGAKNASFLRHFILKIEHLPRQARDKHRNS